MTKGKSAARIFAVLLGFQAPLAWAQDVPQDSAFDRLAKAAGLVAPAADPPDFVKASRPQVEPTAIPVFSAPDEPRSHVKTKAELKAMDSDLESAGRRQQATADPAAKPAPKKPKKHAKSDNP